MFAYISIGSKRRIDYAIQSIEISESLKESSTELSRKYQNLGFFFQTLNMYRFSVKAFENAVTLKNASAQSDSDLFKALAESCYKAGQFRKALAVIEMFPSDSQLKDLGQLIQRDVDKCFKCAENIENMREYGIKNINAQATINLLTSEIFIGCAQEDLNPVSEKAGELSVALEHREFSYFTSEDFCDTVFFRTYLNIKNISDSDIEKANKEIIETYVSENGSVEGENHFLEKNKYGVMLMLVFAFNTMKEFRRDCINVLYLASDIAREIELMFQDNA